MCRGDLEIAAAHGRAIDATLETFCDRYDVPGWLRRLFVKLVNDRIKGSRWIEFSADPRLVEGDSQGRPGSESSPRAVVLAYVEGKLDGHADWLPAIVDPSPRILWFLRHREQIRLLRTWNRSVESIRSLPTPANDDGLERASAALFAFRHGILPDSIVKPPPPPAALLRAMDYRKAPPEFVPTPAPYPPGRRRAQKDSCNSRVSEALRVASAANAPSAAQSNGSSRAPLP
jgi:hypothetical protein